MKDKKASDFYKATDTFMDSNGLWSICKECCQEIFDKNVKIEGSMEKALYKTCRLLNLKYDEATIEVAKQNIDTMVRNGKTVTNFFGIYKSKLLTTASGDLFSLDTADLTFQEAGIIIAPADPLEDHIKGADELQQFWGDELEYDDYVWLEKEYGSWKTKYDISTPSEESLLKLIIWKLYDIRAARRGSKDTSKLEDSLQKLLTTCALSPATSNLASQGKNKDTLGLWIKDIETKEPAEWWKDHSIYKDVDNIKEYWNIHVLRPFLNFWQVKRDFEFEGAVETINADEYEEESRQSEE
jgi:hypothetical protein